MSGKGSAYLPLGVLTLVGMAILTAGVVTGNIVLTALGTAIAVVVAVGAWLMTRED